MARILVVDDEESERLLLRSMLESAGHVLFFAADGAAALRAYRESAIDLVLTDLRMPRLNGLRLIRELKELEPDAVIVAISGVAAEQLPLAEDLGAVRTLFKPVAPAALLQAVANALAGRSEGPDPWGHERR